MANCNTITLANIGRECKNGLGGIKDIWIINSDEVSGVTPDTTTEKITDITLSGTTKFSHWQFRPETASMTSTANIDNAAGTLYVSTELALQFSKMESVKRLQVKAATIGDFVVVVRDNNDKLFYLGKDNPVSASAATGASGTAMGDLNGYNITLTDLSKDMPMEVEMTEQALTAIGIEL